MTGRPAQVFVIVGSAGEYDEYREWNVAAFTKEAKAREYADNAQRWASAATAHFRNLALHWADQERWLKKFKSPYDPEWQVYDTSYNVQSVPLHAEALAVVFTPKRFRRTKEPE